MQKKNLYTAFVLYLYRYFFTFWVLDSLFSWLLYLVPCKYLSMFYHIGLEHFYLHYVFLVSDKSMHYPAVGRTFLYIMHFLLPMSLVLQKF